MTVRYGESDRDVVDYHPYCLDPEVQDRQTGEPLWLRGPRPETLEAGQYFACVGAAQTFGRFCGTPFPALLQQHLGIPALNLGRGGAGPSFFGEDNDRLLPYLNRARFVVVQVMAARSEGNSLYTSRGLGYYYRVADGEGIGCDDAFRQLLQEESSTRVKAIVSETRQNWIDSYVRLLESIEAPRILFWFSTREPRYTERYNRGLEGLFGAFPQLVNRYMVGRIRGRADRYVECISRKGLPQTLVHRETGRPTTVKDEWSGGWEKNWYYPSPEMHRQAAELLLKTWRKLERPRRAGYGPGG